MATYSICAMRSASRSFAIFSSFLFAALRSSFGFDHAQFRSLLFCHLRRAGCSDTRTFKITGGRFWAELGRGCGAVRPAVRGLYRMTQIVLAVLVEGHILPFELRQHSPVSGCKRRLYYRTQHRQQPGAHRPGPCHRACLRALAHCEFQPCQALCFFVCESPRRREGEGGTVVDAGAPGVSSMTSYQSIEAASVPYDAEDGASGVR